MARKRYTAEDIILKLREAEVLLSQGNLLSLAQRLRRHGQEPGPTLERVGARERTVETGRR